MARRYSIEGPDKHLYEFDGPENASQDQIMGYAKQLFDKRQAQVKAKQNKGTAGDLFTSFKQGVAEIPAGFAGLVDIPGELLTGKNYATEAGKKLADITGIHPSDYAKSLEEEKSEKYQKTQQEAGALFEAYNKGEASVADIAAFYAKNPALTATNITQSLPAMLLGGVYARALKGVSALAPSAIARSAVGEGAVTAGQINTQLDEEGGGSRKKALAALGGGAGVGLITAGSGKLAKRLGIIDPETFLAGESKAFNAVELKAFEEAAQRGIVKRFGVGALQEGVLQELPQSVLEQMVQNYGAGKPIMEGVTRSAIEGTLAGSVIGGGFNTLAGRNVAQQIQAKKDADAAAIQAEAQRAERQATGVMEQQPLFTPEEAPIPEPTLTPQDTAEPISTIGPEEVVAEQPVPEGQGDLFTAKGKPSKDALASVETARLQGLPSQIEALNQTPEGREELAGNMKTYFPDLSVQERNKTRLAIQRGTYGVTPAAVPEGTLTPELLKTFGITPRNGDNYKALAGANLADPITYTTLTTAAASNTDFGVKANRILEAFPQFNPNAVQPDLFGVPNAPKTQVEREPEQPDLFGIPQDGSAVDQSGTEQGLGEPVLSGTTTPTKVEEPIGGGVDVSSGPTDGDVGTPTVSPDGQPNTLVPIPKGEAKKAAATMKKEPVATTWSFLSDTPYAKLSKVGKDRVIAAHKSGTLTQFVADNIEATERKNARVETANKINKPEAPIDDTPTQEPSTPEPMPDIAEPSDIYDEVKYIEKNLTGKTPVQAAQWLAKNIPNKGRRVIAQAVARQLEKFQKAGYDLKLYITVAGGKGNLKPYPKGTRGGMGFENGNVLKPYIVLNGVAGGTEYSGLTFRTSLHELTHMATRLAVAIGASNNDPNVARLKKLRAFVINTVREKYNNGEPLTDLEKGALQVEGRKNNAFEDVDELIAWSLSNKDMQALMESIPYQGNQTLWSEFVTIVRNLMGIPATANTALSEVLSASEGLLNADVNQMNKTLREAGELKEIDQQAQAQAQQYINGMSGTLAQSVPSQNTTTAQVLGNIGTTMVNNPSGAFGMIEEMVNRFRSKVIDKGAYLAAAIQDANDGAFYDVNGTIRADLLLSAANNVNNFINAVFTTGGMEILPNGSMRAKDANHSIDGVFRQAQKLGERIGVEQARALITNAFYHYRAKAIIDNVPRDQWPENWRKDPRIVPTQAQINAAMAAFKQFPELQAMQTEFIGAKNEMVKFLEQASFLSPEKAKAFLADDSYAPWLRLKDYQDQMQGLGNTGKMVDLRQMKALVGGTEEVNDMLENMAQMIGWCVRSGVANHTGNSALSAMTSMGTATRHKMRPTSGNPAHVVMTYEAGKPVYHVIDNPYDLAAFQSVSGTNSAVVKELGKWLGKLRAGIVLFPAFPLRQVVMDSQRAFVESGVDKPWAMMGKIYSAFLTGEAFRGTSPDMQDMMKEGVIGAVDYSSYDSTRGRAGQFGMGEAPKTISDKFVASSGYQFLHRLAYSADAAVRLGIYRQTLEETGDRTLAATRAREIINFQKSGTSQFMNVMKQTIPFMGAYLQGMDVNYKGMVGRGNSMKQRKAAAAAYWGNMATYAGLVILYTMMRSGDDDYEEQKGFITDRNFVIPGGGLIPVPPDVGFLAKVIPERITDYILQEGTDDPESAIRLRQGIIEAASTGFLPPSAVYGVVPAVELTTNYSFFSDMPIVSERLQGLEPFQQYTASTSEFAKDVGDAINASPIKIDYIFNAIGGTSAGAILQLADVIMGSNKMAADKTPVIGSFQQKTIGGRYAEEYYTTRELTERAYNTAKAIQAEGDEAKLEEYISRPEIQARLQARDSMETLNTAMRQVSQQRNAIMNSPDLSPDEKREAVNELLASVEAGLRDLQIRRVRSELE
jgi:hypothetical protein